MANLTNPQILEAEVIDLLRSMAAELHKDKL